MADVSYYRCLSCKKFVVSVENRKCESCRTHEFHVGMLSAVARQNDKLKAVSIARAKRSGKAAADIAYAQARLDEAIEWEKQDERFKLDVAVRAETLRRVKETYNV